MASPRDFRPVFEGARAMEGAPVVPITGRRTRFPI